MSHLYISSIERMIQSKKMYILTLFYLALNAGVMGVPDINVMHKYM